MAVTTTPKPHCSDRRAFLKRSFTAGAALGLWGASTVRAEGDGRPAVKSPRATSGDVASEPNWDERIVITVGPKDARIVGTDDKALQAAVDLVTRWGGGTVQVLPGTYRLRNAVHLTSNIRLVGSGDDSVLVKEPSVRTKLVIDSDWYDQEITVEDGSAFKVGDGVCLQATNPHTNTPLYIKRTLVARSGNRFKLDRALRENLWLMGKSTAVSSFPILTGEHISGIAIENIALDGNKAKNELLDGNHAGCVFLQDCRDVVMHRVTARNYNGDGLSWQICHDVRVTDCHSHDHTGLGLHPGSGSQRPLMRGNRLENNQIGLFFCWGVRYGLAEKNTIRGNRGSGISIGHRDTDNIVRDNDVADSGQVGILFRPERGEGFSGDRNLIEGNRVVNSGGEDGIAIDVQGYTSACKLVRNELGETRGSAKRTGVRLGEHVGAMELAENKLRGFATEVVDLRKPA
jgi:hypothetical protein